MFAMRKIPKENFIQLMFVTFCFYLLPTSAEMECENVTEIDIYHFFEQHAPPSHWIRPVKKFKKISVCLYGTIYSKHTWTGCDKPGVISDRVFVLDMDR